MFTPSRIAFYLDHLTGVLTKYRQLMLCCGLVGYFSTAGDLSFQTSIISIVTGALLSIQLLCARHIFVNNIESGKRSLAILFLIPSPLYIYFAFLLFTASNKELPGMFFCLVVGYAILNIVDMLHRKMKEL